MCFTSGYSIVNGVANRSITGRPHLLRNTARIRAEDDKAGQARDGKISAGDW